MFSFKKCFVGLLITAGILSHLLNKEEFINKEDKLADNIDRKIININNYKLSKKYYSNKFKAEK